MTSVQDTQETTVVDMPTSPRLSRPVQPAYPTQVLPQRPRTLRGVREVAQGTLRVMEGAPSGWTDVALGTTLRAALIGTGFYVTGTREWRKLVGGSFLASGLVTLVLFAGHAVAAPRTP
jgi:hypothetical protein